ncbi:MAG: MbcA/ParS/Xre antitoxin family protein [Pseudomonadota bacterium]|nr:MbcA/ParS/Xre antitoxin family protein [Pseudomonadota bacterium]
MDLEITSEVAKKLFRELAAEWALTQAEQNSLLSDGVSEKYDVSDSDLYRISALIGIYRSLQMLLGSDQARRTWIRKPNNEWDGLSALEIMSTGRFEDIQKVNRYLQAWCEQHNF